MPGKRVLNVPQLTRWSEHPELAEMSENEETHQTHLTQQALNSQNLNNYKKTNPKASYSQVLKHNTNNRPSKSTKKTYQGTSSSSTDVSDSSEEEFSELTNDNTKKSRKKCLRCKNINSKQSNAPTECKKLNDIDELIEIIKNTTQEDFNYVLESLKNHKSKEQSLATANTINNKSTTTQDSQKGNNRDGVDKQLAVTSLYRSPHYDTEKKEWSDLLQSHKNFDYIVIGGDFNSHHPAWGSTEPSKSGENLIDTISNHEIIVINDGSHTYYKLITSSEDPSNKHVISSALDLTLISSSISKSTKWRVTDDKMHSDHFPVEYTITIKTKTIPTFHTHKLKLKKTNWKLYHSILHRFIEDNLEQINGLNLIQKYGIIIKTVKIATKTYLNSDKMNELLSKCLLAPDESTLHEELDNSETDIKEVWRTINKFKDKKTLPSMENDISLIENSRNFAIQFCQQDVIQIPPQNAPNDSEETVGECESYLKMPLTIEELDDAIDSAKKNSSPGLDQIEYIMLQNCPENLKEILLSIINEHINNNTFPEDWKSYLIILLPKDDPKKFRPIALASCILKITEKIINTKLLHHSESNHILPESQHGFRKAKSCTLALAKLTTKIYKAYTNKEHYCCVILDIRSAFDNVCPVILQNILKDLKIPNKIKNFINNLVINRKLYFKIANQLEVLSKDVEVSQYADDTMILCKTENIDQVIKYLRMIMDHKLTWTPHINNIIGKATKLTNVLKVLRSTWWGGDPHLLLTIYKSLIRSTIEYNSFITYSHKHSLAEKLQKIQNHCIRLAVGYRVSTALNVIYAETNLLYLKTRSKQLALKFLLKVSSISNSTLIRDINELKNDISRSDKYQIKNKYPLIESLNQIQTLTNNSIKTFTTPLPYEYNYTTLTSKPSIDTSIGKLIKKSNNPQEAFEHHTKNKFENYISIYTDGSKKEGAENVGLAMLCPHFNSHQQYKIDNKASIFTAESLAILMAVGYVLSNNIREAVIYTDSLNALTAIDNYSPIKKTDTSYIILDVISLLSLAKNKGIKIRLTWIPAHVKITHNEAVDTLAKEAANTGTQLLFDLHHTDLNEEIIKIINQENKQQLLNEATFKGVRFFTDYYKDNKNKPWFAKSKYDRYHITTINRLRANHHSLAESLHRKNIIDTQSCQCGFEIQDIDHILFECPLYSTERKSFKAQLKNYTIKNSTTEFNSSTQILKEPNNPPAKIMTNYLKKIKIPV
ncbi:uncharacterized protein LOC106653279 [Trichogramma pretiosum]|uniref:uncharacterized protein LOC106653279 n=1 Tax=Trichogramma pretiosum TaxID=7493 RepID=UPI0006C95CA8|nr:uncharacterized protein LOC106653279 [Trichogramma pretiosum]